MLIVNKTSIIVHNNNKNKKTKTRCHSSKTAQCTQRIYFIYLELLNVYFSPYFHDYDIAVKLMAVTIIERNTVPNNITII